jgi:hypothetical protein
MGLFWSQGAHPCDLDHGEYDEPHIHDAVTASAL